MKLQCQRDNIMPMFNAVLFTIAKIWKKPKFPSTDKFCCIHIIKYESPVKTKKIM